MKTILKWFGYIPIDLAQAACVQTLAAANRDIQRWALEDFGVPANQNCEKESIDFAVAAFKSFIKTGDKNGILKTPNDIKNNQPKAPEGES